MNDPITTIAILIEAIKRIMQPDSAVERLLFFVEENLKKLSVQKPQDITDSSDVSLHFISIMFDCSVSKKINLIKVLRLNENLSLGLKECKDIIEDLNINKGNFVTMPFKLSFKDAKQLIDDLNKADNCVLARARFYLH